eukprot:1393198-Amorphochlora_amoeboformis.AAC.2
MYAAKSIPKAKLNTDERNLVASEIKILSEINHPHCCMLIEAFESEKKIYLIQEIMRGPTLFDRFAQNSEEDITEWHVAICVQKIAKALAYLHSKVHGYRAYCILFALAWGLDRIIYSSAYVWSNREEICFTNREKNKKMSSQGILHRDLKPQNIMFAKPASEDKEMKSLKLLDFGKN